MARELKRIKCFVSNEKKLETLNEIFEQLEVYNCGMSREITIESSEGVESFDWDGDGGDSIDILNAGNEDERFFIEIEVKSRTDTIEKILLALSSEVWGKIKFPDTKKGFVIFDCKDFFIDNYEVLEKREAVDNVSEIDDFSWLKTNIDNMHFEKGIESLFNEYPKDTLTEDDCNRLRKYYVETTGRNIKDVTATWQQDCAMILNKMGKEYAWPESRKQESRGWYKKRDSDGEFQFIKDDDETRKEKLNDFLDKLHCMEKNNLQDVVLLMINKQKTTARKVTVTTEEGKAYMNYVNEHRKNVKKIWNAVKEDYQDVFAELVDILDMDKIIAKYDESKYNDDEFEAYRQYFNPEDGQTPDKDVFNSAWETHIDNNPHHWEYWVNAEETNDMPVNYLIELLCDWSAMGLKFGDTGKHSNTPSQYFEKKKDEIIMSKETERLFNQLVPYFDKTVKKLAEKKDAIKITAMKRTATLRKILSNLNIISIQAHDTFTQVAKELGLTLPETARIDNIKEKEHGIVEYLTEKGNTQKSKIGKAVKALWPELNDADVQKFVELYLAKTATDLSGSPYQFEIDNDASRCYSVGIVSCVNSISYKDQQAFYKNVPAKALLLKKDGKYIGRALLWNTDTEILVDRVYPVDAPDIVKIYHNYAENQGWEYRKGQGYNQYDTVPHVQLTIENFRDKFELVPYMDTFRFGTINGDDLIMNNVEGELVFGESDGVYVGEDVFENKNIFDAVSDKDINLCKRLIESGIEINDSDSYSNTPLNLIAQKADARDYDALYIAQLLIDAGADVNTTNRYRDTPLGYAVYGNNTDLVKLLIDNGANVNKVEINDKPLLFWALFVQNKDIVELLINAGVNTSKLNEKDKFKLEQMGITATKVKLSETKFISSTGTMNQPRYLDKIKSRLNGTAGKQVGTIYHFTTPERIIKILKSGVLIGSHYTEVPYVSFTRDKAMPPRTNKGDTNYGNVRIVVDGNKLSQKYKVTPYDFQLDPKEYSNFRKKLIEDKGYHIVDEMEERVQIENLPILPYIIKIDILPNFNPEYYEELKLLTKQKGIQLNTIKNFSSIAKDENTEFVSVKANYLDKIKAKLNCK